MTSHAPIPGRPTRPCIAELLAAAEIPATTAGPVTPGPKIPPFVGENTPGPGAPADASKPGPVRAAELLIASAARAAVPAAADPKLPPFRGD